MASQTWCARGYGFSYNTNASDVTKENLENLLLKMKEDGLDLKEGFDSYFEEHEIENPTLKDYETACDNGFCRCCMGGFCQVIAEAISHRTGLTVECEWDELNGYYCLLLPVFTWQIGDNYPRLTQKEVDDTFNEYTKILFGHEVHLQYHDTSYFG